MIGGKNLDPETTMIIIVCGFLPMLLFIQGHFKLKHLLFFCLDLNIMSLPFDSKLTWYWRDISGNILSIFLFFTCWMCEHLLSRCHVNMLSLVTIAYWALTPCHLLPFTELCYCVKTHNKNLTSAKLKPNQGKHLYTWAFKVTFDRLL